MTTTTRPFRVTHLRLPLWIVACGHRDAHSALPLHADQQSQGHTFSEVSEDNRCIRCAARYRKITEASARRAERDARRAERDVQAREALLSGRTVPAMSQTGTVLGLIDELNRKDGAA
jgi:hypothetical protein